jgi:rubrerythrin
MTNLDLNLLDAIRTAMEAEQKAAAFYANAAQKTANPLGQELFSQPPSHPQRRILQLE